MFQIEKPPCAPTQDDHRQTLACLVKNVLEFYTSLCLIGRRKVYPTAGTKSRMKSLFNLTFDYALEYEIVDRNYAFAESIGSKYLLNDKGQTHTGRWIMTYDKYANRFLKVCESLKLNPEHRAHDPGYHRISVHRERYRMVKKRYREIIVQKRGVKLTTPLIFC